jgi:primosomal protein N' (replication factor Y)
MFVTVLIAPTSPIFWNGLTYSTDTAIPLGSLVLVPLRKAQVEGIVIAMSETNPESSFAVKPVTSVLSKEPLLSPSMLKLLRWMSEYYYCAPRQVLQIMLQAPPWQALLGRTEKIYAYKESEKSPRGPKQKLIVEYLKTHEEASIDDMAEEIDVTSATLKTLTEAGFITEKIIDVVAKPMNYSTNIPRLSNSDAGIVEEIIKSEEPCVLLDDRTAEGRTALVAALASETIKNEGSVLILHPDMLSAESAALSLQKILGPDVLLLTSATRTSERRQIFRRIGAGSAVLVGTRTALFAPFKNLKTIIIENEHEWTYKSEQTPKYHARLAAEVLATFSNAKLILASATPSLETMHHAVVADGHSRYKLVRGFTQKTDEGRVQIVDLTQANFGSAYPFTAPLVEALQQTIKERNAAVLLLNRKGMATSLLCMECRQTILSPDTKLPMSVISEKGKQMLFDRSTGHKQGIPETCPHCGSVSLKAVGAGTDGAVTVLKRLLPDARIVRVDSDTLERPDEIQSIIKSLDDGEIDVLLGTQPVLRALSSPRVTLAGILIADLGLSLPSFRAGERVFQTLKKILTTMAEKTESKTIVQTFRPAVPEIALAVEGKTLDYLNAEEALRRAANYPPSSQIIRLIIRGRAAQIRATELLKKVKQLEKDSGTSAHMEPSYEGGQQVFSIILRGKKPRELLKKLQMEKVSIDVDPIE